MKKSLYIFMIGAVVIGGVSCVKDNDGGRHGLKHKVNVIGAELDSDKKERQNAETKTFLNLADNRMQWEIGDRIGFFSDNPSHNINNMDLLLEPESLTSDGYWAMFNSAELPSITPAEAGYYAYYPFREGSSLSGKILTMTNLPVQLYDPTVIEGKYFPMAGVFDDRSADDINIMFKNIFSMVKLELYSDQQMVLQKIVFRGNGGEIINGEFTADLGDLASEDFKLVFKPGGATKFEFDMGAQGVDISTSSTEPTALYMVVPPMHFENGFSFKFVTRQGSVTESVGETRPEGITFERNMLFTPGALKLSPDSGQSLNDPDYYGITGDNPVYANGYVAYPEGKYTFDGGVIGNGQKGIDAVAQIAGVPVPALGFHTNTAEIEPATVKLLWQTSPALINDLQMDEHGQIEFSTGTVEGNAVIAACGSSNEILWSWHIWVTGNDFYSETGQCVHEYESGHVAMDRNLGAGAATQGSGQATGLYYQWGRKDPFMSSRETAYGAISSFGYMETNSIADAIETPYNTIKASSWVGQKNAYLWGNPENGTNPVKSIYDPCPPGYMIPMREAWREFSQSWSYRPGISQWDNGGMQYTFGGKTTWFPAVGNLQTWYGPPVVENAAVGNCASSNPGKGLMFNSSQLFYNATQNRGLCYQVRCVRE